MLLLGFCVFFHTTIIGDDNRNWSWETVGIQIAINVGTTIGVALLCKVGSHIQQNISKSELDILKEQREQHVNDMHTEVEQFHMRYQTLVKMGLEIPEDEILRQQSRVEQHENIIRILNHAIEEQQTNQQQNQKYTVQFPANLLPPGASLSDIRNNIQGKSNQPA